MSALTAGKTVTTGNEVLDNEIQFLTEKQIEKLADYAKYLRWTNIDDENDDWAGDWRLIMKINEQEKLIFIRALGSRGDVYKK